MKNIEILELSDILSFYAKELKNLKGAKFAYTVIKNIDIIEKEAKSLLESKNVSEKYSELEKKRLELCEKHADKDDKNEPIKKKFEGDRFEYSISITKMDAFNADINALFEENKEAIEEQKKYDEDFKTLLNSESDIVLKKISIDDVPSDISVELFAAIKKFIKDEE